ncbi:PAS domain S-box protein [Rhodobacterales bacterium HKCCE4037]|nr:PAS domain S-box protein [Rhodobacterales bacterium HKCCE4037]
MRRIRRRANASAESILLRDLAIDLRDKALTEHTMVNITNLDGLIESVNTNFLNGFGYSEDELIGHRANILYGERNRSFDGIRDVVSRGMVWQGQEDLVTKTGETIRLQTTILPRYDEMGVHSGSVSVRTDLTSAIAQGAEAARNAIAENLPDEIFVYDLKTFAFHYANAAGRRRLSVDVDFLSERKSVLELLNPVEAAQFKAHIAPLIDGDASVARTEMRHRKGEIEVTTHKVHDITGTEQLVSVVRDITERKRAEQMKLTSVSTVSHELRTPLTSIRGALRLLEAGVTGELSPEAEKLVRMANKNSEQLLAIVNDILTLQKLSCGELSMNKDIIDLRDLLSEAIESNALFARECDVHLVLRSRQTPAMVEADSARLMQVMSNLISNAAKFSPPGSGVELHIQDLGDKWRVAVSDEGPGIPEHARDTIFNSFTQVEGTKSDKHPSTGLGLTICKEVVRQHDGEIGFESTDGRGSTFHFDLPKHVGSAESVESVELELPRLSA